MSGVIRALGRIFTLSKLHPVVFIAAHIHTHKKESLKSSTISFHSMLNISHDLNVYFLML